VFFVFRDEEIIAALFYDHEVDGGHPVDEDGVVAFDQCVEGGDHAVGWSLQSLAESEPSPGDPRKRAPTVDVWGDGLTIASVLQCAVDGVERRGVPGGLTYAESLKALCWQPVGGWPADCA